ncbi:hypothetical protein Tco_0227278 [Tanacetum coccineum]
MDGAPRLSPTYVPDPIKLDEHVSVYVSEPEHPEYLVLSDDDMGWTDKDPEEDLEEDPNEEHESEDEDTKEKEPSKGSDETEPFEEDETDVTPPPPRHRRARIYVRPQTPMAASTQALIDMHFAARSLISTTTTIPAMVFAAAARTLESKKDVGFAGEKWIFYTQASWTLGLIAEDIDRDDVVRAEDCSTETE